MYSSEERAGIGMYAVHHKITAAKRRYSKKRFGTVLNESTLHAFKVRYLHELSKTPGVSVRELPSKKRGRPVLLGEKMDVMVQQYVEKIRSKGGTINTDIVKSGAHSILETLDKTRFGGPARMNSAMSLEKF